MNILDHRILIPSSQETVWAYISDLTQNPSWQADCSNVSFVSTQHSGVGVRWRYTTSNGRSYIAETTVWYEKLGYEYTFIDGVPFRESKGRIRLQEIAEGTIVQWTFSYEMGGFLGGVRNAVAVKRQLESNMIESLRSLWSAIQKSGKSEKPREAKSLMRDAPNYEARAQYKPRHPSKMDTPAAPMQPVPIIAEPPVTDEDTRPRIAAKLDTSVNEPVFLSNLSTSEIARSSENEAAKRATSEAFRPVIPPEPLLAPRPIPNPEDLPATEEDRAIVGEKPDAAREVAEVPVRDVLTEETQEDLALTTTTTAKETPLLSSDIDTSEISVFELFGIPRPSETQEMRAVAASVQAQTSTLPLEAPSLPHRRMGLRAVLRRKRVRVRRPG